MARVLIVGCGCRGRSLGSELAGSGWAVRGTTRDPANFDQIAAAGIEPVQADPDSPGTIVELLGDVSILVWLLGSATGPEETIEAIHGPRLERLLEKVVDSPVRGVVYEAAGSVAGRHLERGRAALEDAHERWQIPVAYVDADPTDPALFTAAAVEAVMAAISG